MCGEDREGAFIITIACGGKKERQNRRRSVDLSQKKEEEGDR